MVPAWEFWEGGRGVKGASIVSEDLGYLCSHQSWEIEEATQAVCIPTFIHWYIMLFILWVRYYCNVKIPHFVIISPPYSKPVNLVSVPSWQPGAAFCACTWFRFFLSIASAYSLSCHLRQCSSYELSYKQRRDREAAVKMYQRNGSLSISICWFLALLAFCSYTNADSPPTMPSCAVRYSCHWDVNIWY